MPHYEWWPQLSNLPHSYQQEEVPTMPTIDVCYCQASKRPHIHISEPTPVEPQPQPVFPLPYIPSPPQPRNDGLWRCGCGAWVSGWQLHVCPYTITFTYQGG